MILGKNEQLVPSFPTGKLNDLSRRVSSLESASAINSFETVSLNLNALDSTLNYDGSGNISSIVYSNGITKTLNYTDGNVTSIVLSGTTPGGIELTKTLTYTDGDVTGITYT